MATSFCHPMAAFLRLSFESQPPIFSGAAAPGGRRRLIVYSVRPFLSSRTRRRDFQPRFLFRSPMALEKLSVRCGAVKTIGQSEFAGEVLGSDIPVLVEFVADWCGPCRLISPVIEWASQEYSGRLNIVKIDHDANPELIEEYKIYGLPALILFKNGHLVPESRREGAITKNKLKEYLDSLLGSTTVV